MKNIFPEPEIPLLEKKNLTKRSKKFINENPVMDLDHSIAHLKTTARFSEK